MSGLRRLACLGVPFLVIYGAGCRSAGPAAPQAGAPSPPPDLLRSFVGQTLILRHQADTKTLSFKSGDLATVKGDCDAVVEVSTGTFEQGTARFALHVLGRPRLGRRGARQEHCAHDEGQTSLSVSGFPPSASAADLESALGQLLQTPEAFLKSYNLSFDLPPGKSAPTPVADYVVTTKPERLIWADAIRQDPTRKIRYEGEVEVEGVVGTDGRLYDGKVLTPLSNDQLESVRRVLPVWRFQPGRKCADPVAARVREHLVFRIFY